MNYGAHPVAQRGFIEREHRESRFSPRKSGRAADGFRQNACCLRAWLL